MGDAKQLCAKLADALGAQQAAASLEHYLNLILKWQQVHNLTGASTFAGLVDLAADCAPLIRRAQLLQPHAAADLGSGAGMPGLLLALACPQLPITLIESRTSKAAFLQQAIIELQITKATVASCRIENWQASTPAPNLLCVRAVAPLAEIAAKALHFTRIGCRMLALKPKDPADECKQLELKHKRWKIVACSESKSQPSRWLVEAQAIS